MNSPLHGPRGGTTAIAASLLLSLSQAALPASSSAGLRPEGGVQPSVKPATPENQWGATISPANIPLVEVEKTRLDPETFAKGFEKFEKIENEALGSVRALGESATIEQKLESILATIHHHLAIEAGDGLIDQIAHGRVDCDVGCFLLREVCHELGLSTKTFHALPRNGTMGHAFVVVDFNGRSCAVEPNARPGERQAIFSSAGALLYFMYGDIYKKDSLAMVPFFESNAEVSAALLKLTSNSLTDEEVQRVAKLYSDFLTRPDLEATRKVPQRHLFAQLQSSPELSPEQVQLVTRYIQSRDQRADLLRDSGLDFDTVRWEVGEEAFIALVQRTCVPVMKEFEDSVRTNPEAQCDSFCANLRHSFRNAGVPVVPFRQTDYSSGRAEIVFRNMVSGDARTFEAARVRNAQVVPGENGSAVLKITLAHPLQVEEIKIQTSGR